VVANRPEERRHCAADLLNYFANEFFLTRRVDCSRFSHIFLLSE
jgi:hypothetical protein